MIKSIITVDGLDGSGKSTFTGRLIEALAAGGQPGVAIRVDDFRRPVDWASVPSEQDAYYNAYYDLAACETCLAAFAAGDAGGEVPVYDIATERRIGTRSLVFEGISVAVLEGVFPLRMPSAAAGTLIFLETSEAEARRRIIRRDLAKGRTEVEITHRIDCRYFPSQARYRAEYRPRDRAEIVIDNERPTEPRGIERDLGRLPPRLREILAQFLPVPDER
jgi:uridine kinase